MAFQYLLSFVEISESCLKFDSLQGQTLRCCDRKLHQFASESANQAARSSLRQWQESVVDEAAELELQQELLDWFDSQPELSG